MIQFKNKSKSCSDIRECLFQSSYFDSGRRSKEAAERPKLKLTLTSTSSAATTTGRAKTS